MFNNNTTKLTYIMTYKLTYEEMAKNAILWIDKLKKTRVRQGTGALGDCKSGYCCLGYGCKVLKVDYDHNDGDNEEFAKMIGLKYQESTFDVNKQDSFEGIDSHNGKKVFSLIDLNDSVGYSFRRISTFIKNNTKIIFIPEVSVLIDKHYGGKGIN